MIHFPDSHLYIILQVIIFESNVSYKTCAKAIYFYFNYKVFFHYIFGAICYMTE